MNDDFLHRLRQPPPAAFAARLKARLETLVVARRFRRRQFTLYTLLACLLGSTAVALVVPAVRETARVLLREVLPESWRAPVEVRASLAARSMSDAPQPLGNSVSAAPAVQSTPGAPATPAIAATRATRADAVPPPARGGYAAGGGGAPKAAREVPNVQLNFGGVASTAAALAGAISEFQEVHSNIVINTVELNNGRAFVKLCAGELDVALTTRLIAPPELETCRQFGVVITAVPLAYEASVVLANAADTWLETISLAELRLLFYAKSQPSTLVWSQLRNSWPSIPVEAFALDNDRLVSAGSEQRSDSSAPSVAAQRQLLERLERTVGGLTHVPFTGYLQLESTLQPALKIVKLADGSGGAVLPSRSSITDGSYPMAQPLLLFIRRGARYKYTVQQFVQLALRSAEDRLAHSQYLALTKSESLLAADLVGRSRLPPFDLRGISPSNTRELLLQQFPENEREALRSKLPSN